MLNIDLVTNRPPPFSIPIFLPVGEVAYRRFSLHGREIATRRRFGLAAAGIIGASRYATGTPQSDPRAKARKEPGQAS